jgi:uncharacterized protein (DUF433 family)
LLEAYPHISKDAIFACLAYAADTIKKEKLRQTACEIFR